MLRYLPHVVLATALIAGIPVALAWLLIASDAVTSPVVLMLVTVAVSLVTFRAGAAIWKRHPGAGELLFGELMIWGWLRRLWSERRLDRAVSRIGPAVGGTEMGPADRAARLRRLSEALEAADPYTHGHSRRVARYSATTRRASVWPRRRWEGSTPPPRCTTWASSGRPPRCCASRGGSPTPSSA